MQMLMKMKKRLMVMKMKANKNIFMGKAAAKRNEIDIEAYWLYWGASSWVDRTTGTKIKAVGGANELLSL